MDVEKFKAAYNESRNGANYFVRHPLVRKFQFSDGVEELANAGCWWLLDIIATECLKPLRESEAGVGYIAVHAKDSKARLSLEIPGPRPILWEREISLTDLPDGDYEFELVDEGARFAMILITEH